METETYAPAQMAAAIEYSEKIGNFCGAMAKAQAKIKNAERDAENPYFKSTYSSLAGVWDAVRAPLTENELCVVQGEKVRVKPDMQSGEVDVTTMVLHSSGEWFRTTITLPIIPMSRKKKNAGEEGDNDVDRAPGKITPQAVGSAITYGRRYGLESMTGTAPEAEDDDGNSASGEKDSSPIPEGGAFEDVIEAVTFETKKKRDGVSTFVVAKVKTGKHGLLECWEEVGLAAKPFAGTAQAIAMRAENGKYGWKLIELRPIEAAQAEPAPEIDPVTKEPYPAGIAKARAYMRSHLAGCKTEQEIDSLVAVSQKSGSAYRSTKVTCLVDEARVRVRAMAGTEERAAA